MKLQASPGNPLVSRTSHDTRVETGWGLIGEIQRYYGSKTIIYCSVSLPYVFVCWGMCVRCTMLMCACTVLVRACTVLMRACTVLMRSCTVLVRSCTVLVRSCTVLMCARARCWCVLVHGVDVRSCTVLMCARAQHWCALVHGADVRSCTRARRWCELVHGADVNMLMCTCWGACAGCNCTGCREFLVEQYRINHVFGGLMLVQIQFWECHPIEFHNTVYSVLHNQICKILSIIKLLDNKCYFFSVCFLHLV